VDFAKVSSLQKIDMLVSFLDLQGFGSIAHVIRDPVELFAFMNGWASTIIREVEGTGGRALKFVGDECLVIVP
jgi:class 3 adenylate cyclase